MPTNATRPLHSPQALGWLSTPGQHLLCRGAPLGGARRGVGSSSAPRTVGIMSRPGGQHGVPALVLARAEPSLALKFIGWPTFVWIGLRIITAPSAGEVSARSG